MALVDQAALASPNGPPVGPALPWALAISTAELSIFAVIDRCGRRYAG